MPLVWTRSRDGEHNGKPCYEYAAVSGDRQYHITWASDRGGTFGFTAFRRDPGKPNVEYLTERWGIQWWGTLGRCKTQCELINAKLESEHA